MLKKLLAVIISVLCIFSCMSVASGAALATPNFAGENTVIKSDPVYSFDVDGFASYVAEAFGRMETHIDISSFAINRNSVPIYNVIYDNVVLSFNLKSIAAYYGSNNNYMYLEVTYLYTKAECEKLMEVFEANVAYLLRDLNTNTLSAETKALLVHDRLVAWADYDYQTYSTGIIGQNMDKSFGPIVLKNGVCSGYSRAYRLLLGRLGIKCDYVNSEVLNHAWNVVTINGKKYHVDTTWDDPLANMSGRIYHRNYLLSSNAIRNNDHEAVDFDSTPTDTTYDNYWWRDIYSEIQLFNGEIYYIKQSGTNGTVVKRNGNTETTITTINDRWPAKGNAYYSSNYSSLVSDGNYLYVNSKDTVYRIDKNGTVSTLYAPVLPQGKYIYGLSLYNGEISMCCQEGPNSTDYASREMILYRYGDKGNEEDYPDYTDVDDIIEDIDDPGTGGDDGGDSDDGKTEEKVSFFVSVFRAIASFFRAVIAFISSLF